MAKIPVNLKELVILVGVIFSGKRDAKALKMVFDPGVTITTISVEIAVAIGCDHNKSKRKIEMITVSGTEYISTVILPEIKFSGFTLRNIDAICHNLPPQSFAIGLVGINVLKNFDVFLKFRSNILEIVK
ncbi:MAG: retropepsin-like aspartic protease [Candidatus Omnitrophota bacterium]